jgi:hypothetical protein
MDTQKNSIMASLLVESKLYLLLPGRAKRRVLFGFSENYPSRRQTCTHDVIGGAAIGYEAGWAGVCQNQGEERNAEAGLSPRSW